MADEMSKRIRKAAATARREAWSLKVGPQEPATRHALWETSAALLDVVGEMAERIESLEEELGQRR